MATEKASVTETNAVTPNTSDSEKTNSVAEKKPVEYVEYFGPASRREITVEQWAAIGVEMPEDTNWMFGNGFRIPKEVFSEAALKYLLNETRSNLSKSFRIVAE